MHSLHPFNSLAVFEWISLLLSFNKSKPRHLMLAIVPSYFFLPTNHNCYISTMMIIRVIQKISTDPGQQYM